MPDSVAYDIGHFLSEQSKAASDKPALLFRDQSWSWSEFSERVSRVAGGLAALGASGKRIVILDKNHPATLELSLGAAQVGAVAVIVNHRLAADEIEYVVKDSNATAAFVGKELLPLFEPLRAKVKLDRLVVIDGEKDSYEAWLSASPALPKRAPKPDDCFLQLYTSGTTGYPKGAMLTHRSMVAHSRNHAGLFHFKPSSVSLVPMPLFHVGGISWALACLERGVPCVISREPAPPAMFADIAKHRVTHTFIVPALLHAFMMMPDLRALDSIECIIYGASPMPLPLLQKCLASLKCDFLQVYGMTEMSGVFCALDQAAHRDSAHPERLVSAGKMTPGNELRVVDPGTQKNVDPGTVGEFWVRGQQVMAGYYDKPDATRDAILQDGWLRTGDAGFVDSAGFVFVQDRVKDMVISGGENIYPAEVERVLVQHSAVSEVAVFGVPDEKWGETVRAAVALKPGQSATAEALMTYCREHLAGFKCPSAIDFVPSLPRNATGKVLKRTLREPYWAGRARHI
jgi:acyl-CoA synthetase (AMP-forming)/AMP-acid ligase II